MASSALAHHQPYRPPFQRSFFLPRYWPAWLALGLLRLGMFLPRRVWAFIGARLGDLYYHANAKRRAIARINIDLCFPELSAAERHAVVRAHFRTAMQCLLDVGWLWWASPERFKAFVQISGLEHYRAQVERGRSIILMTCHCVALEMGAVISLYYPQAAPLKPVRNALANWFIVYGRGRFGARLFTRDQGLRPLVRALQQGLSLYYLPDEDLGTKDSVFVPFFGVPAATLTTVGRLARLGNAAVLPYFMRRRKDGRGYEVVIKPALDNFPTDDPVADATRMNQALEEGIREAPEQYLWTFKRFKSRPGNAPSPYPR